MKAKLNLPNGIVVEAELTIEELKQLALKKEYKKREIPVVKSETFTKKYRTRNRTQRSFKQWTTEEIRELWVLKTKGRTVNQIAKTLGRSKQAVKARIWIEGKKK